MSKHHTTAWDNHFKAARIPAAEVRPADAIAAAVRAHDFTISSHAFRDVGSVEPLPDGATRITYYTAAGTQFVRDFPAGTEFYRLPAMPEARPLPAEPPAKLEQSEYDKTARQRDSMSYLTAYVLHTHDDLKQAREYAARAMAADAILEADQDARAAVRDLEASAAEEAGGPDRDPYTASRPQPSN